LQQTDADVVRRPQCGNARINLGYTKVTARSPADRQVDCHAGALSRNQATALATIQQLNPIYIDVTQSSADVVRLKRALAKGELKKTPANEARVALMFEDGRRTHTKVHAVFRRDRRFRPGRITLRALFPNPQGDLFPACTCAP